MPELAYVNGVFGPIAEAKVSIEDRGFQFGDGIYEVIVAYGGKLFLLDRHLQRMHKSAAGIGLEYDFDGEPLEPLIVEGLRRSELRDAMIYVQITRGVAPRSHVIPKGLRPTVVMTFKPLPTVPDDVRRSGVRMATALDTRWANCYIKAITLLPNTLTKTDAVRRGYHDAIFVTASGEVRECTSANVFIITKAKLRTPVRTESILHGITQSYVMELAGSIGLTVEEGSVSIEAMRSADEVFMSGTTIDVLGITSIDDRPVGDGKVGPITRRLYEAFARSTRSK